MDQHKQSPQTTGVAGLDVDTRFLLANERTFLAWMRTALTLMAGGLALAQLGNTDTSSKFGMLAVLFGAVTALTGYMRYQAADGSIRKHQLPSKGHGPGWQLVGIVTFAIVVVVAELLT